MATWADVVAVGTRFPGVEESTSYGTPSLKVRGKFMCRLRTNPDALVVRVIDVADQEALLKGNPDVFFITPHYDGWPGVLVRLEAVDPVQLAELIEDAWRLRAPKRINRLEVILNRRADALFGGIGLIGRRHSAPTFAQTKQIIRATSFPVEPNYT